MKTWVNGTILEAAESFVSVFDHAKCSMFLGAIP